MSTLWLDGSGKVLVDGTGRPYICVECPCNPPDNNIYVDIIELEDDFDKRGSKTDSNSYGFLQNFQTSSTIKMDQFLIESEAKKLQPNYMLENSLHYTLPVVNNKVSVNQIQQNTNTVTYLSGTSQSGYLDYVYNKDNSQFLLPFSNTKYKMEQRNVFNNTFEDCIATNQTIKVDVTTDYLQQFMSDNILRITTENTVTNNGVNINNIIDPYFSTNTLTSDLQVNIHGGNKYIFSQTYLEDGRLGPRYLFYYKNDANITNKILPNITKDENDYYYFSPDGSDTNKIDITDVINSEDYYFNYIVNGVPRQVHMTPASTFYYREYVDVSKNIAPYIVETALWDSEYEDYITGSYYYTNNFKYKCYLATETDGWLTATINSKKQPIHYNTSFNGGYYLNKAIKNVVPSTTLTGLAKNNKLEFDLTHYSTYSYGYNMVTFPVKYDATCGYFYSDVEVAHSYGGFFGYWALSTNNTKIWVKYHGSAAYRSDEGQGWGYGTAPNYDNWIGVGDNYTSLPHTGTAYGETEGGWKVSEVGGKLVARYYFINNQWSFRYSTSNGTSSFFCNKLKKEYYYITNREYVSVTKENLTGMTLNYYNKKVTWDNSVGSFYFNLSSTQLAKYYRMEYSHPKKHLVNTKVAAAKEYYVNRIITGTNNAKLYFKELYTDTPQYLFYNTYFNYYDKEIESGVVGYDCENYAPIKQHIGNYDYIFFAGNGTSPSAIKYPAYYNTADNKFYYYNGIAELSTTNIITGVFLPKVYLLSCANIYGLSTNTSTNKTYTYAISLNNVQNNIGRYHYDILQEGVYDQPLTQTILNSISTTLYTYYYSQKRQVYYDSTMKMFYLDIPSGNHFNVLSSIANGGINSAFPFTYKLKQNYTRAFAYSFDNINRFKNPYEQKNILSYQLDNNGKISCVFREEPRILYYKQNNKDYDVTNILSSFDTSYFQTFQDIDDGHYYSTAVYDSGFGGNMGNYLTLFDITSVIKDPDGTFEAYINYDSKTIYHKLVDGVINYFYMDGTTEVNATETLNNSIIHISYNPQNPNLNGLDPKIQAGFGTYYFINRDWTPINKSLMDITNVINDEEQYFTSYIEDLGTTKQIYSKIPRYQYEILTGWFVNMPSGCCLMNKTTTAGTDFWTFDYCKGSYQNEIIGREVCQITGTNSVPPPYFYYVDTHKKDDYENYYTGEYICNIFSSYYVVYPFKYDDETVGENIDLLYDCVYDSIYGYKLNTKRVYTYREIKISQDNAEQKTCYSLSKEKYKVLNPYIVYDLAGVKYQIDGDYFTYSKPIASCNFVKSMYEETSNTRLYDSQGVLKFENNINLTDDQSYGMRARLNTQLYSFRFNLNTNYSGYNNYLDSSISTGFSNLCAISCQILTGMNFNGSTLYNLKGLTGEFTGVFKLNTWYTIGQTPKTLSSLLSSDTNALCTYFDDVYNTNTPVKWNEITPNQINYIFRHKRGYDYEQESLGFKGVVVVKPLALLSASQLNNDMDKYIDTITYS